MTAPKASLFGPLKTLLYLACLWLPLSFFIWFYFAQLFVMPVAFIASTILQMWMPSVITGVEQLTIATQDGGEQLTYLLDFVTSLPVAPEYLVGQDLSQGRPAVVVEVNPMIYGYSIPVLCGLVMATPLSGLRRAAQIAGGGAVLLLVQTFGSIFDAMKSIALQAGPEGAAAVARYGISPELIAFAYQFGYLVLPSITPVILWVMFNQRFIQTLITTDSDELPDETSASGAQSQSGAGQS